MLPPTSGRVYPFVSSMVLNRALILTATICVASCRAVVTSSRKSSACYSAGGQCGFHFLACELGLTIVLQGLQYGFKGDNVYRESQCSLVLNDCSTLANRSACCEYDVNRDCLKESDLELIKYNVSCGGKTRCQVQTTITAGGCDHGLGATVGDTSTYSVITYACENRTSMTSSDDPVTSSTTRCDLPGCVTMTSPAAEDKTKGDQRDVYRDENTLQLIVGVSVGVGSGVISLVIIAAVCWLRMRMKPPSDLRPRSTLVDGGWPRISSTCRSHTLTSRAASSLPSSLYSDSGGPSSSHRHSVYSAGLDLSNPSSLGKASFLKRYLRDLAGLNENQSESEGGPGGSVPRGSLLGPARFAQESKGGGGSELGQGRHHDVLAALAQGSRSPRGSLVDSAGYQKVWLPSTVYPSLPDPSEGYVNHSLTYPLRATKASSDYEQWLASHDASARTPNGLVVALSDGTDTTNPAATVDTDRPVNPDCPTSESEALSGFTGLFEDSKSGSDENLAEQRSATVTDRGSQSSAAASVCVYASVTVPEPTHCEASDVNCSENATESSG